MSISHIVGIDPGLVHTGVVSVLFKPQQHTLMVEHQAVAGLKADDVIAKVYGGPDEVPPHHIFIEGYRPRLKLNNDRRMIEGVRDLHRGLPRSTVLDNMGVKKVVTRGLMEKLGLWTFATPTHHQDLRSAARILILGMLKDPRLNQLLSDIVLDSLPGGWGDWKVVS